MFRINIPNKAECTFPARSKSVELAGRHALIQLSMENGHCHGDGSVSEQRNFFRLKHSVFILISADSRNKSDEFSGGE